MCIDEAMEFSTIVKVTCKEGRIITIKFTSTESKNVWLDHFVVIVDIHREKTKHAKLMMMSGLEEQPTTSASDTNGQPVTTPSDGSDISS